ncbi:MAG: phosphatidylglycerophosphatase A family protein, partial [Planctomycetota bacterium]
MAASCFGLGFLPLAPGTWGSLPPAIIYVLLGYFVTSGIITSVVMLLLALIGSIVCVACAPAAIDLTGKSDPREVVADEFAGQALTFVAVGAVPTGRIWAVALLGFVLFRLFDIVKPWPIRKLEKLPAGWGILADDLMAGVYTGILLLISVRLWL